MLKNARASAWLIVPLSLLAACGTTRNFIEQPQVTVDDPRKDAHQAAAALFALAPPYKVTLCEADPESRQCKQGNAGISATGVGGLLIPLKLHVTAVTVSKLNQTGDNWALDASLHSKVDTISPLCQTAHGQIISRANDTISIRLEHFYCNWVVVGNVLVNTDLSIDNINLEDRAFSGFYRVTFHGTGNAAGSGYYKAVIVPAT
jgi:hypothetical protein